jgi:hypothetical protein
MAGDVRSSGLPLDDQVRTVLKKADIPFAAESLLAPKLAKRLKAAIAGTDD